MSRRIYRSRLRGTLQYSNLREKKILSNRALNFRMITITAIQILVKTVLLVLIRKPIITATVLKDGREKTAAFRG